MARVKKPTTRNIRCYLCGKRFTVSTKTMSTTCPACNKAIKVEDVIVKSYVPVILLQTCGTIKITKRGRVAAKQLQSGDGIDCEGTINGNIETEGTVRFGPNAVWKGRSLHSRALDIQDGATLIGEVIVPWSRSQDND